jgi:hypothetical protein
MKRQHIMPTLPMATILQATHHAEEAAKRHAEEHGSK